MRISGNGRANELAKVLLGVQETEKVAGKKQGDLSVRRDQVEISKEAKELQRIKTLIDQPDLVRTERVEQIRKAIEAGTYDVKGKQVADAIIRDVLTDAVL
ncbi:MAG: flagellar biosynthesis anti-sigma factor FlgM [Nitrospirota bacterium]